MADVTINNLTSQAPTSNDVFPFSTTGVTPSTYKATLAQLKTGMAIDWTDIANKPSIGTNAAGARTVSTSTPTGGSSGDIWYQV